MATYQTDYGLRPAIGLPGQVVSEEKSNRISRTVESAAGIAFGQPAFRGAGDHGVTVGGTFAATSVGAAVAGNTGAETITAAPPVAAGAKEGVYKLTALTTGATAIFLFEDPDGISLGEVTTGTPATIGGIGPFTITDAGTDPAIGDQMTITVSYTLNDDFIGIAILNPAVPPNATTPDAYEQYFTGAFMTMGSIYVTAGATVAPGDPVYWNPATSRFTNTVTHVRIPGAFFDTSAVNGGLVEITLGGIRS